MFGRNPLLPRSPVDFRPHHGVYERLPSLLFLKVPSLIVQFSFGQRLLLAVGPFVGLAPTESVSPWAAVWSPAKADTEELCQAEPDERQRDFDERRWSLDERRWSLDVAGAPGEALIRQRLILYAFTGSDWSSQSQRWMENTLGKQEFLEEAEGLYHLVQVDQPKSTTRSARVKDCLLYTSPSPRDS